MLIRKAFKLKTYSNHIKCDTARYCSNRFNFYVNGFLGHLFFNNNKNISTKGLSKLTNQAQHRARYIIKAQKLAQKQTKNKINVPIFKKQCCPCIIEKSKTKTFDYWIKISNQWTKTKIVNLPVKSHKALNKALKDGWKLSQYAEFFEKDGQYYVLVFVSKEINKASPSINTLGCDVGIKHSVVTTEGYMGHGLSKVIRRQKQRQAERRRQGHKISSKVKTEIKQLLNIEAKRIVRRSKNINVSLIVESPKQLANLRSGKFQGWARSYFANRCHILGKENGVFVLDINPAYTSITCSKCGNRNKENRLNRDSFKCSACGYIAHADFNAASLIGLKGGEVLDKILSRQSESHSLYIR